MAIPVKDIKILWGRAGGRCSKPGCGIDCIQFIDENAVILIGEMAHIIAKKSDGPRGVSGGGGDTYSNLILLCPTHHTEIDKSPNTYSVEELYLWKDKHEAAIAAAISIQKFESREGMAKTVKRLLIRNRRVWQDYGPESEEASRNPMSNLVEFWNLRKLDTVVPNNTAIIQIIQNNEELIDVYDLDVCYQFVEHSIGFEQNCYNRVEGVKRFPQEFLEIIDKYADE